MGTITEEDDMHYKPSIGARVTHEHKLGLDCLAARFGVSKADILRWLIGYATGDYTPVTPDEMRRAYLEMTAEEGRNEQI